MIFRLTKNAKIKLSASYGEDQKATNRYCDWFVDTVDCDGDAYFLLTNPFSLFSLLIPAKKLDSVFSFVDAAIQELRAYFEHAGLSPLFDKFIGVDCDSSVITGTNSRSIIAAMKGMKANIPGYIRLNNAPRKKGSLFAVDDELNKKTCKCLAIGGNEYTVANEIIGSDEMREPVSKAKAAKIPARTEAAPKSKKPRASATKQSKTVYCLHAELEYYKPKMWRRILVPSDFTMAKLAYTLMSVFRAGGYHMYSFEIPVIKNTVKRMKAKGRSKAEIDGMKLWLRDIQIESSPDSGMNPFGSSFFAMSFMRGMAKTYAARKTKLCEIFNKGENPEFYFTYDFGDDWSFKIKVEDAGYKSPNPVAKLPIVIAGKGYGIIEDCGGPGGLESLREAFGKKSGKEYEEFRDWLERDDLDLSAFDIDAANLAIEDNMKFFDSQYKEMEKSSW